MKRYCEKHRKFVSKIDCKNYCAYEIEKCWMSQKEKIHCRFCKKEITENMDIVETDVNPHESTDIYYNGNIHTYTTPGYYCSFECLLEDIKEGLEHLKKYKRP